MIEDLSQDNRGPINEESPFSTLSHPQRERTIQVLSTPLREKIVDLPEDLEATAIDIVRSTLLSIHNHPYALDVNTSDEHRIQQFFHEQDEEFEAGRTVKPVFFSGKLREVVISQPDLQKLLSWFLENQGDDPSNVIQKVHRFALNRLEFSIHEYGHIASANKLIQRVNPEDSTLAEMKKEILAIIDTFRDPEIGRTRFAHVLSDLRAEVFRRDITLPEGAVREIESFARDGVEERVLPGGRLRCPAFYLDSIFRMAAWHPLCRSMGPYDYAEQIEQEILAQCGRYAPQYVPLAKLTLQYLSMYVDGHRLSDSISGCH